jgi:hypothetical protein
MSVWFSMPACAARRYDASTAAPPTGLPATSRPVSSWPWKSLKPSTFTCRLPPVQSGPSGMRACEQIPSGVWSSDVHGLPSSQAGTHVPVPITCSGTSSAAHPLASQARMRTVWSPSPVGSISVEHRVGLLAVPVELATFTTPPAPTATSQVIGSLSRSVASHEIVTCSHAATVVDGETITARNSGSKLTPPVTPMAPRGTWHLAMSVTSLVRRAITVTLALDGVQSGEGMPGPSIGVAVTT